MSRARRILDLLANENTQPEEKTTRKRKFGDDYLKNNVRQYDECSSSPIPEGNEEELIQLQDLLGDVFDDHVKEIPDEVTAYISSPTDCELNSIQTSQINSGISKITTCIVPETSSSSSDDDKECEQNISTQVNLESLHDTVNISTQCTPMASPQSAHGFCGSKFCPSCEVPLNIENQSYSNLGTPSTVDVLDDVPTPSSTTSRKQTFKKDKGKKRLVHKDNWLVVERKLLKNKGKSYTTKKGKSVPQKTMQVACKCRLKCGERLSQEERLNVFKKFWDIGDRRMQWEFVIKYTMKRPKRRQTTEITKHNRQNTFVYFLPNSKKEPTKVCKTMFLNTISCGERIISTAWQKYDGDTMVDIDRRGVYKHSKRIIDEDMIKSVCDHVKSFAPVEAHYVRQSSSKLYLEGVDSISRMFKLYCEWFDSTKYNKKALTKRQYTDIVNSNFNLGLHKPKKDCCDVCHIFKNINTPSDEEKKAFEEHQAHKTVARELKKSDKTEATDNKHLVAATFDFEKVLVTPHGEVSVLYYKRKLATLNFTVFNLISKIAVCYMWHEGTAKRGANEVSSCLYQFLKDNTERGVKEFRFWSDNCSGQNRNRIVFSLYLLAAKEFGVTITHRFMEKGHTQNEGDSVHSTIDRASRRKMIYTPEEWYCLVRWAKTENEPYVVREMKRHEFFDFKSFLSNKNWTKNTENEKIIWTHIREVRVNADQFDRLEYKYDLRKESKTIFVLRSGTRNAQLISRDFELKQAYDGSLPINQDKYKDLIQLCQTKIIPERYHDFYKTLAHVSTDGSVRLNNNADDDDEDSE